MNLTEAAYLVVYSDARDEWEEFATHNLGAMTERVDPALYIRLDEFKYRLLVLPAQGDDRVAVGWATRDKFEFARARQHLEARGVAFQDGTDEECLVRGVSAFVRFRDPAGNNHEICWGRTQVGYAFASPAGVSFVTGALGFGHAVLPAASAFDETIEFFENVFGFAVSDFFRMPSPDGKGPRVNFLHPANSRQHSLAVGEFDDPSGLNHFMVEVSSIDELGRMMDRAVESNCLRRTIGRHVNDNVISFYMTTPSGFLVEYGYGGKQMDWDGHDVRNISPGTLWGHRWI